MPTIYVLKCAKGRYYIGKTDRPIKERIIEHFTRNGSEFTKKFIPQSIVKVIENADNLDEDKYTKIYMKKYGVDKVRGGSYAMIDLPDYKLAALYDELCTAENRCYRCMRKGHFTNNCYATTYEDGTEIETDEESDEESGDESEEVWCCSNCDKEFLTEYDAEKHAKKCKIKKLVWCCDICDKEFLTEYDAERHEKKCKSNQTTSLSKMFNTGLKIAEYCFDEEKPKSNSCFKCGRFGHYASDSYARKHINGKILY